MAGHGLYFGKCLRHFAKMIVLLATSHVLAGCGLGVPGVERATVVPRPKLEQGIFPVAEARRGIETPPPRFAAEMPATVEAFRAETGSMSSTFLRQRLCAGDPDVVARLGRAVDAAAKAASPDELRESYGTLLEYCGRREMCAWTREATIKGGALADVAWVGLAQCGGAANDAIFETDRAPARLIIEYWSSREWNPDYVHRFVPAIVPALRHAIEIGDSYLVRRGALVLGEGGDPNGVAALIALHKETQPGKPRDELAVGLVESTAPEARAIFDELCQRPGRKDVVCDRQAVVTDTIDLPGATGLRQPNAAAGRDTDVKGKLEALGLLWRGPLHQDLEVSELESQPESARDWLVSAGPVHCFDVETGQVPNEHDGLLFDLAELSGPPLSGALFAETPPPIQIDESKWLVGGQEVGLLPEGSAVGDPYRLVGYLGGYSYSVEAQDFGDWYDLDQVVGLLNAMALDQAAQNRFVVLPTGDQTACVLAASNAAILAGVSSGLLEIEGAGAALASGQAFEAAVLDELESGKLKLGTGE